MKKCCGVHTLRIAVGIMMLALLLVGGAGAATITVNASGGGDYTRIQDAIDNGIAGDTILVYSGIYYEKVNVTKQLTLRGVGNPVVDAAGSGSAITLSADGITIEGFTATRGGYYTDTGIKVISSKNTLTGNIASNNGWNGISLSNSSNNTLTGNIAKYNSCGGIYLSSSGNNTLSGNTANSNGYGVGRNNGGISLSNSSNNTLIGNNADANNYMTGISLESSNNNTLIGNNANSNYGEDDANANGISLGDSNNNTLSGNNASYNYNGNGISLGDSNNNTLIGNNANSNKIYDGYIGGRGISLIYSNNNMLSGNNAFNNEGGGIFLYSSRNNKIYNNIFNNINNFYSHGDSNNNSWNTKKQSGTNIIGGPILGGNFWGNPDGTGFSQTCKDMNSNGICEKRYILESENNIDYLPLSMNFTKDTSPPKSVSNLKNVTYAKNYINWTWKNPKDLDFKKVMVFVDNNFKRNVSKGKRYYNATNFTANTRHTISTRTVDLNGNINKTWTNRSAWTAK